MPQILTLDEVRIGPHRPHCKVNEDDVREMRRLYDAGLATVAELARMYGLTHAGARLICRRETWRDVV